MSAGGPLDMQIMLSELRSLRNDLRILLSQQSASPVDRSVHKNAREIDLCHLILDNLPKLIGPAPAMDEAMMRCVSMHSGSACGIGTLTYAQCRSFLQSQAKEDEDVDKLALRIFVMLTGLYIRENSGGARPVVGISVVVLTLPDRVLFVTTRGGVRNAWMRLLRPEWSSRPVATYVRDTGPPAAAAGGEASGIH